MAKRSPILGFNHNVRHRGLLFHVQTEDSGIDNPHIYTQLFHGGIILSSRKLEYDRESAEEVVKALMQAQHKAALRQLKAGEFDDKISAYLGDHPELQLPAPRPRAGRDTLESMPPQPLAPPAAPPEPPLSPPPPLVPAGRRDAPPPAPVADQGDAGTSAVPSRTSRSGDVSNAFRLIKRESTPPGVEMAGPAAAEPPPAAPARPRTASQTGYAHHRTGQLEIMADVPELPHAPAPRGKARTTTQPRPLAPRPPPGAARPAGKPHAPPPPPPRPTGKSRPPPTPGGPPPIPGVVARPAVIVGAPPRVVGGRPGEPLVPRAGRRARDESRPGLFGKDLISERSLDEVILAYLSEDSSDK